MSTKLLRSRGVFVALVWIALFAIAPYAHAQLSADGIFSCSGAQYANPGTLSAIGGVYVPVNDAAVTLNTGYLVYKECVLDGVNSKISEAARTEAVGAIATAVASGRAGEALYRKKWGELDDGETAIVVAQLQNSAFTGTMSPNYEKEVVRAYARRYAASLQQPNQSFATTFPGSAEDHRAFYEGRDFSFEGLLAMINPCNNARGEFEICFGPSLDSTRSEYAINQRQEWLEGGGFYSVTDENTNPLLRTTRTPASLVQEGALQAFTGGFRCLEGADELSEICAPLFAGLTTQLIADVNGLSGITQSASGIPSYVSRMVSEASSAVQQGAVNAALGILSNARQVETLFKQAKEATATILTNAINSLRATERTCWDIIIQNVCTASPVNGTCTASPVCITNPSTSTQTCTNPGQLRVATSTQFSQSIIDTQIAPRAVPIAQDIQASDAALAELDQIIASVTNTASATTQRTALERLDSLVANNLLHDGNDVVAARSQTDATSIDISQLIDDTLSLWGDSTDPNIGWCNINNPALLDRWRQAWHI